MKQAKVNKKGFTTLNLPYNLKPAVFEIAMDDLYDVLATVNAALIKRGLLRLEESVRGAIYSGMLSDLLVEAVGKHSTGLTTNLYHNGHPDLIPVGQYANDKAQSASQGVEVKVTSKPGGAVDMHGARPAWYCVFRYVVDFETQPVVNREPTRFTHIWLAKLTAADFRKNPRGTLGTRTATPHRQGVQKLRTGLLYEDV